MDDRHLTEEQLAQLASAAANVARDIAQLRRSVQALNSAVQLMLLDAIEKQQAGRPTREFEIAEAAIARLGAAKSTTCVRER